MPDTSYYYINSTVDSGIHSAHGIRKIITALANQVWHYLYQKCDPNGKDHQFRQHELRKMDTSLATEVGGAELWLRAPINYGAKGDPVLLPCTIQGPQKPGQTHGRFIPENKISPDAQVLKCEAPPTRLKALPKDLPYTLLFEC